MDKYPAIDSLINKMRINAIHSFRQDESTSQLFSKRIELQRLLGLLNTTNDINLQVKLFSALSAYLMIYKTSYAIIIKSGAVYDKLQVVLSLGVQTQAVVALNFLSALVLETDDVTASLATHVRTRCRTSGCLAVVNDMFSNRMMYHDTWKAVCQCLAVVCSECETNQSYCTYLIPVCIRKCSETNMDIFLVLHSLLLKHTKNTQVFLKFNGTRLFTREFLHYDKCLQLLVTVVQTDEGLGMIRQTKVLEHLRDLLYSYGQSSEIGQKAIIILNHVSRDKGLDYHTAQKIVDKTVHVNNINTAKEEDDLDDTGTLMQNIIKEIFAHKQSEMGYRDEYNSANIQGASLAKNVTARNNKQLHEMTLNKRNKTMYSIRDGLRKKATEPSFTILNTNVGHNKNFKEGKFSKNELSRFSQNSELSRFSQNNELSRFSQNNELSRFSQNDEFSRFNKNNELSRFRQNELSRFSKINELSRFNKINEPNRFSQNIELSRFSKDNKSRFRNDINKSRVFNTANIQEKKPLNVQKGIPTPFRKTTNDTLPIHLQQSFSPIFSSTMKYENDNDKTNLSQIKNTKMNATNKLYVTHGRVQKRKPTPIINKDLRNTSIGSRLFSAINDSCTTLVKTVTSIFKKKETQTPSKDSMHCYSSVEMENQSCSFSFMKYMQKRDAFLNKGITNKTCDFTQFSSGSGLCETCDNTAALKQKLNNNEYLKNTVKKLKLGINLYGCDFKRISRTMWPQESYMTPAVLYNLYRKLIAK